MFKLLSNIVNSGVNDSVSSGDGTPGNHTGLEPETWVAILITFVIAFLIGFGVRHLIQVFKDAPDPKKQNQDKKGE